MALFENTLRFWVQLGLLDVVLPFILIFTVVYALLQRSRVLGEENGQPKKKLNAMLAFVVGFASVAALQTVAFVQKFAQWSAIAVVVILGLWLVLGLVGAKEIKKEIPTTIGMIVLALFALYALGGWDYISFAWLDSYVLYPVLALVALLAVIWFIAREQKPATEKKEKNKEEKPKGRMEVGESKPVGPAREF